MNQETALTILKTGANVFLTGEPGSGKTHTVNQYIAYLREHNISPSITASTGIAATHVGGMTIHAWSGIGVRRSLPPYELDALGTKEPLVRRISQAKVLIIDEVSMLDGTILDMVDSVCRMIRQNEAPFGGLQVVCVGDFFQLPPVAAHGAPKAQFCFNAQSWMEMQPIVCYLSEQHRQEDPALLEALGAIRSGSKEGRQRAKVHFKIAEKAEGAEAAKLYTHLYTHHVDVDRINIEELAKLPGQVHSFDMTAEGAPAHLEALKRNCLSPIKLDLKEGAVVMFTKNSFEQKFANGTIGIVVSFDRTDGLPTVKTRAGKLIKVAYMDWTVEDGGKVLAKATQLPLALAWAITIHKSQGMSLDSAVVDLTRSFEYGQGYVALSRVRTFAGLRLVGLNDRAFEIHPLVAQKDVAFRERSNDARMLFGKFSKDQLGELNKRFVTLSGGREPKVLKSSPKSQGIVSKEKTASEPASHPNQSEQSGQSDYSARMTTIRTKSANAYRAWSAEEDADLTRRHAAGEKAAVIAAALGRQPGAIRSRIVKLALR